MLSYCLASRENKKFIKDESLKLNPFVTTKDIVTQKPFVFKQTQGK